MSPACHPAHRLALVGPSGPEEAGTEPNVPPPSGVADPTYAPPPPYQGAGYPPSPPPPPHQGAGYPPSPPTPPYQGAGYPPPYGPSGYPAPLPGTNGLADPCRLF